MSTKKKMLMSSAGAAGAGGAGLDITDVFSTYLYDGTSAEHTITNGIDLAGEGGMIWGKIRSTTDHHWIVDSERGTGSNSTYKYVMPNLTTAESDLASRSVSSFNSNGFTLQNGTDGQFNESGQDYASWSFRKAPKFFTCLTYTGTGSAQNISHDLGSDVGFLLIKRTDSTSNWRCWHRGLPGTGSNMEFNQTGAYETATTIFNGTDPTSTQFSVGTNSNVNASGGTYVAYVFAHNDGDGEFGPDGSDIIKCGSYTGNGSSSGNFVDLGFEPQFVIIKNASSAADWVMFDNMRGVVTSSSAADDKYLFPNGNNSEGGGIPIDFNATGFTVFDTSARTNANTNTFIYMAIRRGPLAQPESATEVFAVDGENTSEPYHTSGFPVDMGIKKAQGSTADWTVMDRLRQGKKLKTNSTSAEVDETDAMFDYMDGMYAAAAYGQDASYGWMWKRAPGYFDVVAYSGDNATSHAIDHNLNAVPEMIWCKGRDISKDWNVYHSGLGTSGGNQGYLGLNLTAAAAYTAERFAAAPTSTQFTVGNNSRINSAGSLYISYLFSTLAGVSKVGSYTGTGATLNIDCGFTSGARFVLIKRTDAAGQWLTFDSTRGIVNANVPVLFLNSDSAEDGNYDIIDPHSSGFTVTSDATYEQNISGGTYIFYAIA